MRAFDHRFLLAGALPLCLLVTGAAADDPNAIGIYPVPPESDVVVAYAPTTAPPPPRVTAPAAPALAVPDFSTKNDLDTWSAVRSRANLGYDEPGLSGTDLPADLPPAYSTAAAQDAEADLYPLRERGLVLTGSQQFRGKFKARNGSAVISVGIGF